MKKGQNPTVDMWVRTQQYGLWIGQLKYKAGKYQWLVHWKCRYYDPQRSMQTYACWGLHYASRLQKMRVVTRAEALGELTLIQLAR